MNKQDINNIKSMIHKSNSPEGEGEGEGQQQNHDGLTEEELAAQAAAEGDGDELQSGEVGEQEQGGQGEEEGDGDAAGDEAGQAAAQEGEDATVTPSDLAEAVGWEAGDLYDGLVVPLDDGQEPLALGDLKNGYQDQRRQISDLETQLEQAQTGAQEGQQQFGQIQQMSNQMMQLNGYMQSLDRMEQQTDWKDLEEFQPAEAALKRQKIQQARQETQQAMQQLQQQEQGIRQQNMQKAAVKLVELVPTWKETEAKKADQSVIRTHMKTYGFNDQEINGIADPRAMAMLKELIDLRAQVTAAKAAVKKVRKAPQLLRNAAGRFKPQDNKVANADKVIARAKQTGNKNDQLNAAKAVFAKAAQANK